MASKIVPYFKSNRQSPELIFFDDEGHNEALHTLQFLTLFQLLREGIRVGDGELVLQLYKPCLPIFDLYARTKYRFVHHQNSSLSSCELTLPLSLSLSFLLSTRLDVVIALALKKAVLSKYDAFDFTWNRFANTRGKADSNIPLDLLKEHRIREAKEFLGRLGANFSPKIAQAYTRSLDSLAALVDDLEATLECPVSTSRHSTRRHPQACQVSRQ